MEEVLFVLVFFFIVLFYVWDFEYGIDLIICDGGFIYVIKNCVVVFRNVCKNKSINKWMWVDVICINQVVMVKKGRVIRLILWVIFIRR